MPPRFDVRPVERLRSHEEVDPVTVRRIARSIERSGEVVDPIWVAAGSDVILNGHHRFEALKSLGARWVPVWVLDYGSDEVALGRWRAGPPISKEEVLERGRTGELFPRKTTRHRIQKELPHRPTPLSVLRSPTRPSLDRTPATDHPVGRRSSRDRGPSSDEE
ncbi:MAG: ParB N-terminal domain-containing protein [Thermoplasmata archaeon]